MAKNMWRCQSSAADGLKWFRAGVCLRVAFGVSVVLTLGCQPSPEDARRDSAVASVGTRMDSPKLELDTVGQGLEDSAMLARAAADPDQRFLRWMLDHHAELVTLAHEARAHQDSLAVREEAARLDTTHDAETRALTALLREEFDDSYHPRVRREHEGMLASLRTMSGDAYRRAFREFLVTHHREAVGAADSVLPTLRRPHVRDAIARIRRARTQDIAALERRIAPAR